MGANVLLLGASHGHEEYEGLNNYWMRKSFSMTTSILLDYKCPP